MSRITERAKLLMKLQERATEEEEMLFQVVKSAYTQPDLLGMDGVAANYLIDKTITKMQDRMKYKYYCPQGQALVYSQLKTMSGVKYKESVYIREIKNGKAVNSSGFELWPQPRDYVYFSLAAPWYKSVNENEELLLSDIIENQVHLLGLKIKCTPQDRNSYKVDSSGIVIDWCDRCGSTHDHEKPDFKLPEKVYAVTFWNKPFIPATPAVKKEVENVKPSFNPPNMVIGQSWKPSAKPSAKVDVESFGVTSGVTKSINTWEEPYKSCTNAIGYTYSVSTSLMRAGDEYVSRVKDKASWGCQGIKAIVPSNWIPTPANPYALLDKIQSQLIIKEPSMNDNWIIWSPSGSNPPTRVLVSEAQAKKVAAEMASKNPGQKFYACKVVHEAVVETAVVRPARF